MSNIWIVLGSDGSSIEECVTWVVCWYDNEDDANAHCTAAQKRADKISKLSYAKRESAKNEHDPYRRGSDDTVYEVEILEAGVVGSCTVKR